MTMQEFECTYCVHAQAKMYKGMKTREEKWRYEKCSSGGTYIIGAVHTFRKDSQHAFCLFYTKIRQTSHLNGVFLFTANGF